MRQMKLKEETFTRLVFETDPSKHNWGMNFRVLLIPLLILVPVFIFYRNLPSWLLWIIVVPAILIEATAVRAILSDFVAETIIIDLNSQKAIRTEKFFSIRIKKAELNLARVSRVLIHLEAHGLHCHLILETTRDTSANKGFKSAWMPMPQIIEKMAGPDAIGINYAYLTEINSMKELAMKIGRLIDKPVVFKHTDELCPISEEIIQP